MNRVGARAALCAVAIGFALRVPAEPPVLTPCDDVPAAVLALAPKATVESFGVAPASSVAVVAIPSPTEGARSVLRFAREGAEPREVKLGGKVLGLALTPDGKTAYAIVRVTDRKGATRNVDLVAVNLETARASSGATLPATAAGLAISESGLGLLVASRNEVRTFQLPGLASGPLYRVLGENVGVAPIPGSSYVLLAQPSRVVLADLSGPQDRDGLVLSQEAAAPAPLAGMLASAGDSGPIVRSSDGPGWCVKAVAPSPARPPAEDTTAAAAVIAVESVPSEPPAAEPPPAEPPPVAADPANVERIVVDAAPAAVVASPSDPPPSLLPSATSPTAQNAGPGTLFGVVTGPAVAELEAIVVLGPDNVLHEAARVVPDDKGRFSTPALSPGAYRIVAAGNGGRVLICDPPFVTVRVDSNGAVETPVLKVLSAQ